MFFLLVFVLFFQLKAQNKWFEKLCSNPTSVEQTMIAEGGMLCRMVEKVNQNAEAFEGVNLISSVTLKADRKCKSAIEKLSKKLQKEGFQLKTSDDKMVNVWSLKNQGQTSDVWMIVIHPNSYTILNINGKVNLDKLSQIPQNVQIPALGYLGKAYKKS